MISVFTLFFYRRRTMSHQMAHRKLHKMGMSLTSEFFVHIIHFFLSFCKFLTLLLWLSRVNAQTTIALIRGNCPKEKMFTAQKDGNAIVILNVGLLMRLMG